MSRRAARLPNARCVAASQEIQFCFLVYETAGTNAMEWKRRKGNSRLVTHRILIAGLMAVLGCAHHSSPAPAAAPAPSAVARPSPASSSLEELLNGDMAPHEAIPWSSARRLVWADFQGPPAQGGREAARTAYALFYGWKCRGQAFEFRVTAAFLPKQSWVKAATVRDSVESRRTLQHEQTHFDVSEVYARRMRRYFGDLPELCAKSDDELTALAQRLVQEEKAAQRRYDEETANGLVAVKQAEWDREIARQLTWLSRYKQ